MYKCKLCNHDVEVLQRSHIIPKSAYKSLRGKTTQNPNPIYIGKNIKPLQTSRQDWEYLLCQKCENKFNINGEKYISQIVYKENGDCPIYNIVGYKSKISSIPSSEVDTIVYTDKLDIKKISYFIISIFWRASISRSKNYSRYSLGDKYNEKFRSFLNLEALFFDEAHLFFYIIDQPRNMAHYNFHQIITFPDYIREDNYFRHYFLYKGLFFIMALGNLVPKNLTKICLHHSKKKYIIFSAANNIKLIQNLYKLIKEQPNQ